MSKIMTVGITGRSGSGKSQLTKYYESLGYPVADGDALSREVTEAGSDCVRELAEAFGPKILAPDGSLLRKKLGELAFATKEGNQKLVDITHPYILRRFLDMVEAAECVGAKLFFIDGAMIVGSIFEERCDKLIVVTAEHRLSVSRIVLRDGISKTAAEQRLAAQPSEAELLAKADYVLRNNGGIHHLNLLAEGILAALLAEKKD